jgi:flagellum-specific peptidoglycan hydrolase FlgJ
MTPEQFVKTYKADAEAHKDKLHPESVLVQAAWESSWGRHCLGFNFFGIKDKDGVNGNEQLLETFEFSQRVDLKFPVVKSITPVTIGGKKFYKYVVMDYFRKYNSAAEGFADHIDFFYKNSRYSEALKYKDDPDRFFDEIAKAGYATDPNYAANLKSIRKTIEKYL